MRLAEEGKYRCRFCQAEKALAEGIVTMWGGTVLFALCPSCFPGRPIMIDQREDSQGNPAVFVGFLRHTDRPTDMIVVPSTNAARELLAGKSIAPKKKLFDD